MRPLNLLAPDRGRLAVLQGDAMSPRIPSRRSAHAAAAFVCAAVTLAALVPLSAGEAAAQGRTRVWDVPFGTPASAMPAEFVEPACGTNGGPHGMLLEGFTDFARCPVEPATGLREVWFIYDDEWEYIARAQRNAEQTKFYSANTFFAQPIITSLMFDEAGLLQGYRVVTDTRTTNENRLDAYLLGEPFRARFGIMNTSCRDLPRDPREMPIDATYIKQLCEFAGDGRYVKVETRFLHKAGEDLRVNPRRTDIAEGDFESFARLDVYALDAVRGESCCRASASP